MAIRKRSGINSKEETPTDSSEEDYIIEDYSEDSPNPQSLELITTKNADREVINYLAGINSLDVLEKGLTPEQYGKLKDTIKINSMGIGSNIIRTCQDTCESWNRCPLAIIKKAPLGRACPVEIDLYERLVNDYKEAVIQKIHTIKSIEDVEKDPVILSLISQVVEIEIMSFRANALIADVGISMLVPVFASETGTEYALQESMASKLKRELNNRRDKILRQLLATPEMVQRIKTLQKAPTITEQKRNILDQAKRIVASEVVIDEADTAAEAAK